MVFSWDWKWGPYSIPHHLSLFRFEHGKLVPVWCLCTRDQSFSPRDVIVHFISASHIEVPQGMLQTMVRHLPYSAATSWVDGSSQYAAALNNGREKRELSAWSLFTFWYQGPMLDYLEPKCHLIDFQPFCFLTPWFQWFWAKATAPRDCVENPVSLLCHCLKDTQFSLSRLKKIAHWT